MSSSASGSIWYVYGIVPSSASTGANMPPESAGLDDSPVSLEPDGDVAALVSVLRGPDYAPNAIEANSGT